jgi:glutaminyl-peptide cyclotransferase
VALSIQRVIEGAIVGSRISGPPDLSCGFLRRVEGLKRRLPSGLLLAALVGAGLLVSGSHGAAGRIHPGAPFDGRYAYELTRLQLSFGPRPAGSAAQRAAAARLVKLLPSGRFEPVPGGLRNIVGELPGRKPAIVVAAHYDTTDVPGYLGANNSAAGVGAVIALARALKGDRASARQAVRFVLFDGEEAPSGFTDFYNEGLRGSRAYADAHAKEIREVIVLDFIALHDLHLRRDTSADSALWSRLRAAAGRAGTLALFPTGMQEEVLDDHTPFLRAGVPAIDLIDFDYACWQQVCDDLSKVSRANLTRVGATVLELLRTERLRVR